MGSRGHQALELTAGRIEDARDPLLDRKDLAVHHDLVARRHLHAHEFLEGQIPRLLFRDSEFPADGMVHEGNAAVGQEEAEAIRHGFQDGDRELVGRVQLVARRLQLGLTAPEVGDVAHDGHRVALADRPEGKLDVASRRQHAIGTAALGVEAQRQPLFEGERRAVGGMEMIADGDRGADDVVQPHRVRKCIRRQPQALGRERAV